MTVCEGKNTHGMSRKLRFFLFEKGVFEVRCFWDILSRVDNGFLTVRRGKKCEWPRARGLKMLKASSKLRGCAIFYQAVRVGM